MTTQTEALKLLVEALSLYETRSDGLVNKALAAGKEALAQPEQEPVQYKFSIGCRACGHLESYDMEITLPTTPPQRKPLPYEKVADLWLARFDTNEYDEVFMNFARAIEAAHGIKEKNT